MEQDYSAVVLGGDFAATEVLGWHVTPGTWHGSVLPVKASAPNSYDAYRSWLLEPAKFVVTFDITMLHKDWDLHPYAVREWQHAGQIARGEYQAPNPDNWEWVIGQPHRLQELRESKVLVFDTELSPVWMIGFANDRQVHVTDWSWACEAPARALLQDKGILKVAHNLQHDLAMCDLRFGFQVERPYFDTYGGAHLLNTALERTLSPGIASRFTKWPYHKWLNSIDATRYNGLDNIVCFDGYTEIAQQLEQRKLTAVAEHDHDLLEALYEMQQRGFKISETERAKYEEQTQLQLIVKEKECVALAEPIIQAKIDKFEKPNLFRTMKQCVCCGGGKTSCKHCWRCGGLPNKPEKKADYGPVTPSTVAELRNALPPCSVCQGSGKVEHWNRFNPGSNDQVADVLYRGLRIPARRYKGKETVKAAQLEPIQNRHPLVKAIVEASKIRADLSTVERLKPGTDGCLHCVFDPWGTESGRVASREGLFLPGTNAMNLPKPARRFVVPRDGYVFLYPDMSQIEARAVAVFNQDKGLLRAFTEPVNWPENPKHGKIDSHTVVQQLVSQWVVISRDQAKHLTYAVIYGVSAEQLALELTNAAMRKGTGGVVTVMQAMAMIEAFFKAFPGVRQYHFDVEQELIRTRTLRSLTGRERHWPGRIMDGNGRVLNEIIKQAWSYKPQELGAHILALGLLQIRREHGSWLRPLIHVHDAALIECPIDRVEEGKRVATAALSRELYGMWFPTEMKAGATWYEAS